MPNSRPLTLVVGASGALGSAVARQLLVAGMPVRALSRDRTRLDALVASGADPAVGDLRDPRSIVAALEGVEHVVAAAHAVTGTGANSHRAVDDAGHRALIAAARDAGVTHFVYASAAGARADHPVDFFRTKYVIEGVLRASGLPHTILRGAAFMETWAAMIGDPIAAGKPAPMFGRADRPISFVSAEDVARCIVAALREPARNETVEVGGPEALTFREVAEQFGAAYGRPARRRHLPAPLLKVLGAALRPFSEVGARMMTAGHFMATHDQRLPPFTSDHLPAPTTRLADFAQRRAAAR